MTVIRCQLLNTKTPVIAYFFGGRQVWKSFFLLAGALFCRKYSPKCCTSSPPNPSRTPSRPLSIKCMAPAFRDRVCSTVPQVSLCRSMLHGNQNFECLIENPAVSLPFEMPPPRPRQQGVPLSILLCVARPA